MFLPSQNSKMEKYPPREMEVRTGKVLRRSIYTFLQNYQYFTTTALLAFPFSSAILLLLSSSQPLLPKIHHHLQSLFDAAGFPPTSPFFAILNLKLSQTITSSILVLPFTLSFLLLSKSSTILALTNHHHKVSPSLKPSFSSLISVYNPILLTQICNSLVIISANATFFSLLFFTFNCLQGFAPSSPASTLFLSSAGFVLYSIILANVLVICNLALVSSGTDKSGGFIAILKSSVLIRGRTAKALALALPANILLSGLEALFQFRVARAHSHAKCSSSCMVLEGIVIAYLYSIVIVIDTIVSCVFFKSCKSAAACRMDDDHEKSCSSWFDVEA